ncbi:MAG: MYG1 family protein [Solobacterium sp.]|nr:MYG1 family protein [Solobacterium sp.]
MKNRLNLFTHDGQFHADEVFATAMFSIMAEEINVVRGGDADIPEDASDWIIYDIGGGELDHHSPENKETNGTHPGTAIPYAACGLVWRKYGQEVLEALDCEERYIDRVMTRVERTLILGIDAKDNEFNPVRESLDGIPNLTDAQKEDVLRAARNSLTITDIIKDFNPTWNSDLDPYDCFLDAVSFAKDILLNRIYSVMSSLDARDFVQRTIDYSANHILLMDRFAPWEGILYSQKTNPKANDIWYAIYPAARGGWNLQCARSSSEDRNTFRHPLPEEWLGLRGEELQKITGVSSAQFCHVSGFLCGADTQEDILELASIACGN